ncbi:MAG: hypothetical protein WCG83_01635 [Candidatus Peregrinibacteria bacterium]
MTLDACIAHAIHTDLDILEAIPEVHDLPMEELEPYIERYVVGVQNSLREAIQEHGEPYLRCKDAAGLCATLIQAGITLPASMLLHMCQTIMQLMTLDARFVLDTDDGKSLYFVKLVLAA